MFLIDGKTNKKRKSGKRAAYNWKLPTVLENCNYFKYIPPSISWKKKLRREAADTLVS